MITNSEEEKQTNSKSIKDIIIGILNSLKESPKTFDKVLLEIRKELIEYFRVNLNTNNTLIKSPPDLEEIKLYAEGICSAIEITGNPKDINSDSVLNSFIADPQMNITEENKKELAKILEKQICNQLSDILLGLLDIRGNLKDKNTIITKFNHLLTACNEFNEIVKVHIIDSLQQALNYISKNSIQGIDYNNLDEIEEIKDTEEILKNWDKMILPSQTITIAVSSLMNKLLYSHNHITTDAVQQKELKYALRFFKTLADHLPELVRKKYDFPNLAAIHSDKDSFFKKFTRPKLANKLKKELVNDINELYKTASKEVEDMSVLNTNPTLLDKFKSITVSRRLVIMVVAVAAIIVLVSLLVYILNNKDTAHQMLM
ncbi:hypothetical protein NEOKW01_2111 [Nematocida sp. AWRm80]|nr:hypothetical protein NEOKW01_2111 [Nematocida sp. AWRm80]